MDLEKYAGLRDSGLNPLQVTRVAMKDGLEFPDVARMLRSVFKLLSIAECKALNLYAHGSIKPRNLTRDTREFIESMLDEDEAIVPKIRQSPD
jgi:hypothetical protein